ncbi:hypothetical protein [Kitasatospora brasiliensis]|uniref:hypothetical protein n=1 Tax=Kitasatospora brasiliensis TaxID=3058040 RepID=UPI0029304E9A|nr:hypothetical protein [Kitasatospora sp. K002]
MTRNDDLGRFLYWSERQVRSLAADNRITLGKWALTSVGLPSSLAGAPMPQVSAAPPAKEPDRREISVRMRKALSRQTALTFDSPPPVQFAEGVGRVEFARFVGGPAQDKGLLLHARTHNSSGQRVDLVLFGSLDNTPHFTTSDASESGWSSSAQFAVSQLLEARHHDPDSCWGDSQSLAIEALKIALFQGSSGPDEEHDGRPWTRGFTLGSAESCEWFAVVYEDVVLDRDRWRFRDDDLLRGTERVVIGAPVWVRTASPESLVRYAELRRASRSPAQRRFRFAPFGLRRVARAEVNPPATLD